MFLINETLNLNYSRLFLKTGIFKKSKSVLRKLKMEAADEGGLNVNINLQRRRTARNDDNMELTIPGHGRSGDANPMQRRRSRGNLQAADNEPDALPDLGNSGLNGRE